MPDLDWIVEYETLPPDDPYLPTPEPPTPRRRLPGWVWFGLGLLVVVLVAAVYLWQLGGRKEPLPGPEPVSESLEAVVRLEIDALNSGDEEIFSQVQDGRSHRRYIEPAPEGWFSGRDAMDATAELIGLELMEQDSALATVKLTWNGIPYRLYWFYRQVEGSWRHTDWQEMELGQEEELTSPHVQITHHAGDSQQAEALVGRLERFVGDFCGLLPCPAGPLTVTIDMETVGPTYHATESGLLHYRISSPLRIRWPWDNRPEPVVLSSIGRHLAYDLYLRTADEGVPLQNQAPLTLATFWLVHHLLDLEAAPGTLWLDEAVARDGLPAVRSFIVALEEGADSQSALTASFGPRTAAAVSALPDYFGWLLFQDPMEILGGGPDTTSSFRRWPRVILTQFDSNMEPWAPDGRFHGHVLPEVTEVSFLDGWASVTPIENDTRGAARFFLQVNGAWNPSPPDETALGGAKSSTFGSVIIYYYAWDEPFIPDIAQALSQVYDTLTARFDLTWERPLVISVHPSVGVAPPHSESVPDIFLTSPRLAEWQDAVIGQAVYELAGILLSEVFKVDRIPEERLLLVSGAFLWEMDGLGWGLETYLALVAGPDWVDPWRPPATTTAPEWMPLLELWTPSTTEWEEIQLIGSFHYSVLLLQYIAETYGAEKVPLLIDTLATAETMDEWITAVTGQSLELFEAEWRAWVIDQWAER
jgi:hypothetical protein